MTANRIPLIAGGLILFVLIAGLVGFTTGMAYHYAWRTAQYETTMQNHRADLEQELESIRIWMATTNAALRKAKERIEWPAEDAKSLSVTTRDSAENPEDTANGRFAVSSTSRTSQPH